MLEKIKEVPFIDESSAVRLVTVDGKIVLERNDRVVWAQEATALPAQDIDCYVEADKFFALYPEIKSLSQDTCLKLELKNGAKYELPFVPVSWESVEMPSSYDDTITFKLSDLMLCTLKNLIKPELQCIYIDSEGAVSCDFISACISKDVKSTHPMLLPPDVQELVNGRICKVKVDDKLYIKASDFSIVTMKPTFGEETWWNDLRTMLQGVSAFREGAVLVDALKRLSMFGDYVLFDGQKAIVQANYEPFVFDNLESNQYEIERLAKILSTATSITQKDGALVLSNSTSMFLISPMDEA